MPSVCCGRSTGSLAVVATFACMMSPLIRAATTANHAVKVVATKRRWNSIGSLSPTKTVNTTGATSEPSANRPNRYALLKVAQRGFGALHHQQNTRTFSNSALLRQPHSSDSARFPLAHKYRVYVAVGSNLGDRFTNIRTALDMLCQDGTVSSLVRTSFLHESVPMYVTDQPSFLNAVVELNTNLEPMELLQSIKRIEAQLGRDLTSVNAIRNGPRPVDLDILSYETFGLSDDVSTSSMLTLDTPELTIPHARISEREFVLIPLVEVAGPQLILPGMNETVGEALRQLFRQLYNDQTTTPSMVRVLPLPRGRLLYWNETIVMGILNATPDSFSDGGEWTTSVDTAVERALDMERQGAGIIDIGGESTRPGAKEVSIDEELRRTIPIIRSIRQKSSVPISIDTRHARVAEAAVEAGADIVNDVSGGYFDPAMLPTVGRLGVPMVLMHMRGTPETMQNLTEYEKDIVSEVTLTLLDRSNHAALEGNSVHRWMQIVDPGIGFAKDLRGNLLLLQNMAQIRTLVQDLPLLIGTSRKGFIGTISGVNRAEDRDAGTIASCVAALCLENQLQRTPEVHRNFGCSILRVHNVADCKQAAMVMDAIRSAS